MGDVTLPFGVAMTVNSAHWLTRRSNLDVLLTMHPEPEGQSGQCGNFNGDPDDDTMEMMEDMRVEAQGAAARKLGEAAGCTKEPWQTLQPCVQRIVERVQVSWRIASMTYAGQGHKWPF